jgi:hypothetical protein
LILGAGGRGGGRGARLCEWVMLRCNLATRDMNDCNLGLKERGGQFTGSGVGRSFKALGMVADLWDMEGRMDIHLLDE